MKALIATKNPSKIEGTRKALARYFGNVEIEGIAVETGVPDQPVNNQIYEGAKNRLDNLIKYANENKLTADLYLSCESGVHDVFGAWENTNMVLIRDNEGLESMALSPSFPIPDKFIDEVIKTDLNKVICKLFDTDEDNHNKGGAIQKLTHDEMTRAEMTEISVLMALTRYINGDLWK